MRDPAFELNCFLTRSVYLVIAAVMLGYLSTYEGEVHIALAEQVERTATMEDRLRLACDLHDGPLPPLTGTALQLEIAGRPVETDPQNVGGSLIHPRVARGQATALRTLMRQLEPDRPAVPGLAPSLTTLLEELGDRVEVHWGLPVVSSLDAPPETLGREVCHFRPEALVRVARHARTSRARVRLGLRARWRRCVSEGRR